MENVKHIFFDLDHTLWDFEKNSSEALNEIFFEMKLDQEIADVRDFILAYQGINAQYWDLYNRGKVSKEQVRIGRFIDTLNRFEVSNVIEKAKHIGNTYIKKSPYKKHVFPDTYDTLEYLNNKYKLHIITNGFLEVQHIKLNNSNLTGYFNLILCTEEVGVNKPDPLVFRTALEKTNAKPEESLMIGDNPETDIKGAQNYGMHTILFNPEQHNYNVDTIEIQGLKELKSLL